MSLRKPLASLAAVLALCACSTPTPPPTTPDHEASPTSKPKPEEAPPDTSDPFVIDGLLREEQLPLLGGPKPSFNEATLEAPVKGVPPAPASCDAYVKRSTKLKPTCSDKPGALTVLDQAMSSRDPNERDEVLLAAESCTGIEPGIVRAIRVELAPDVCGDVLAEPVLKQKNPGMSGAVQHTLVGQAIAARLARTVGGPPVLAPPFTKQKVLDFTKKTLFPWYEEQAKAVSTLSGQGRELAAYGRGLVALASGWANLRLVEVVREAPIPDEFKRDPEVANAYYAGLDERLEMTKSNGRDGALVGLGAMAQAGVIEDSRVSATRLLLAKMYGGRRVDALDVIALPHIPDPTADTVDHRLAAKLPTFLAGLLLDPAGATDPAMLRSLMHRGIPMPMRAALKAGEDKLSDQAKALYGRARLELGRRYWRAVDFDSAIALYSKIPKPALSTQVKLELGVAIALRSGPEDVAVLMIKNDGFSPKFADVRALDRFAKDTTERPLAGLALFDAAVLRQIATPRDADAAYWSKLEERYKSAAASLAEPTLRREAEERAKAAAATAKVVKSSP